MDAYVNGHDVNVELAVQTVVADAVAQLTQLWQTFGLSEEEQVQQKKVLLATIRKTCQTRVATWRDEVDRATTRVRELESEIQRIKAQFQGNELAGWCIQSLDHLYSGTLRDKLAALEMELKFLDSIRASRVAEIDKFREHLSQMDAKLGTTSVLPSDVPTLSEEYKSTLQDVVRKRSREVHARRAAFLEAVSECVQLARELQIEPDNIFAMDLNARLKRRDLSADMLQEISQRTVELRELKLKREARLAEMLGQIHDLWRKLQVPEEERERFRKTVHRVDKAALASCEAELTRLQHHHKRFAAITVQVSNLRKTIEEHWNRLGYNPDQRAYFADMMNTANAELSYRVFRAHEKEAEKLKRQLLGMKVLASYVEKREEILQAREEHGVPDERTRLRIERELPKYTAILHNRIAKWETETGVVFCWNGIVQDLKHSCGKLTVLKDRRLCVDQPYLELMRSDDRSRGKGDDKPEYHSPPHLRDRTHLTGSFGNQRRRHQQQQSRHSIEERSTPHLPGMEAHLQRRRSDPEPPERPRWRNFIRSTFSRHGPST